MIKLLNYFILVSKLIFCQFFTHWKLWKEDKINILFVYLSFISTLKLVRNCKNIASAILLLTSLQTFNGEKVSESATSNFDPLLLLPRILIWSWHFYFTIRIFTRWKLINNFCKQKSKKNEGVFLYISFILLLLIVFIAMTK